MAEWSEKCGRVWREAECGLTSVRDSSLDTVESTSGEVALNDSVTAAESADEWRESEAADGGNTTTGEWELEEADGEEREE